MFYITMRRLAQAHPNRLRQSVASRAAELHGRAAAGVWVFTLAGGGGTRSGGCIVELARLEKLRFESFSAGPQFGGISQRW